MVFQTRSALRSPRNVLLSANLLARFWKKFSRAQARGQRAGTEVEADVRALLTAHRVQMDDRFILVRVALGLGLVGYLMVDAMLSARSLPSNLLFMTGYLGLNLCVWSIGGRSFRQARWLYAALDLAFLLLLRHVFLFEAIVDPNATMVGFFTLLLVAYIAYSDPKLTGTMALTVLCTTSLTLGVDILRLAPPQLETLAYRLHPLRAFLLLSYLGTVCLVTCLLTLRLYKQTLAYSVALQRRTQAAMTTAVERARSEKLVELNRLKLDFIAALSQELGPPLTPLRASLEALHARTEADAEIQIDAALQATGRLQRLVQDFSELAELLTQEGTGRPRWNVQVDDLVEVLMEGVRRDRFVFHGARKLAVFTEPHLLKGALRALMRRAEHLTPAGNLATVTVGSHAGQDSVVMAIHDPASSIEQATLSLDDPFRLSRGRTSLSAGTGLELILAQYSLRRIGGHLRVKSARNEGTTVYCTLPGVRKSAPWLSSAQLRRELGAFQMLSA